MLKRLILVRHAKSAWPDGVADHDRPLAKRGRRDAPEIGRWLATHGELPDLALVSSAARAKETFALLQGELGHPVRAVKSDDVYASTTSGLLDLVRDLDEGLSTVMIVGHNPSIGTLATLLDDGQVGHLEFKTSAVAVIDIGDRWAEVNPGCGRVIASALPRG